MLPFSLVQKHQQLQQKNDAGPELRGNRCMMICSMNVSLKWEIWRKPTTKRVFFFGSNFSAPFLVMFQQRHSWQTGMAPSSLFSVSCFSRAFVYLIREKRKTCPENNTQEAQNVSCSGSAPGRGSGFLLRLQMGGVLNYGYSEPLIVLFWITNGDKECLHFFVELFLLL